MTFDEATSFLALVAFARRAAKGKALTKEACRFFLDLEPECLRLEAELRQGAWQPGAYRTFWVRDPKPRRISAAPFRDRVVHQAISAVLEPIVEETLPPEVHACRVGRGTSSAWGAARRLVCEHSHFLKLDVRHYFETIPHDRLCALVRGLVGDPRACALVDRIVAHGAPGSAAGCGLPIGNLTSQHLANVYLAPFDKWARTQCGYVRYMDDMLFFGARDRLHALEREATARIEAVGLTVKLLATRRGPVAAGVPFLGFRFFEGVVRLDAARKRRLLRRLDAVDRAVGAGEMTEEDGAARLQSVFAWTEMADTGDLRASLVTRRLAATLRLA